MAERFGFRVGSTIFYKIRTRKLKIWSKPIFWCHLDETKLVFLISNSYFVMYDADRDKKSICNLWVKKRAFKKTCRWLSSLTFNSHKNCFPSAVLKNKIMSKQQCSQKRHYIINVFTVLKRFCSARIFFYTRRFLAPFLMAMGTPLSIGVPAFFSRIYLHIRIHVCDSFLFLRN